MYYDSEVADRAVAVFYRWCKRNGFFWQQPNRHLTTTSKIGHRQVVEIQNCNGLLAKYEELPSGRLRRIEQ